MRVHRLPSVDSPGLRIHVSGAYRNGLDAGAWHKSCTALRHDRRTAEPTCDSYVL
jgi:hypothetical protein